MGSALRPHTLSLTGGGRVEASALACRGTQARLGWGTCVDFAGAAEEARACQGAVEDQTGCGSRGHQGDHHWYRGNGRRWPGCDIICEGLWAAVAA